MKQAAYCLFETPLGTCGIAWKEREGSRIPPAVTFFQLPEATRSLTDGRIAGSSGGRKARVPPPHIAGIIRRVRKHLRGEVQDFLDIAVDPGGRGPFARQVYETVRNIPPGRTRSYGEIAAEMDRPTASRAVGQALGRNPIPLLIPCHRVLAVGKDLRGFSAHGGVGMKAKLLEIEGATIGRPLRTSPATTFRSHGVPQRSRTVRRENSGHPRGGARNGSAGSPSVPSY